jgi:coenzyme F420-reducing hydrogenase delta subunit
MTNNESKKNKDGFVPEIVVLFCQNSVNKEVELSNSIREEDGFTMKTIIMPCSSRIETGHLISIMEQGVDGIEVVACSGEACAMIGGSTKAKARVKYANEMLDKISYGPDRIGFMRGADISREELADCAKKRADIVSEAGPNPMRDK